MSIKKIGRDSIMKMCSYSTKKTFNLKLVLTVFTVWASIFGVTSFGHAADDMLRVRIGSDIGVLDPARIFGIENQTVAGHIYNGLVKYDQATNKIVPDLATEWNISKDGKTYTFKLHSGVKWHKGYGELTADDVKFSLERVLDPNTKSRYAGQLAGIAGVEAADKLTVKVKLDNPNAGLLNKLTAFNQGWIVSRKAVTEIGDKKYQMQPIGTGPFIFEKWTPGNQVVVVANKDYFGGAPKNLRRHFEIDQGRNCGCNRAPKRRDRYFLRASATCHH
jgi:peptide/nickel transport system substrate-binding protein